MELFSAFDRNVHHWFEAVRQQHADLTIFMRDVTTLGSQSVLTMVVLFAVGLLMCFRRYLTAGFVLAAALGGLFLTVSLKHLVERERPINDAPLVVENSWSFPSGHSAVSAATYLTLAMVSSAVVPGRRARVFLMVAGFVLVGLIGVSRLYIGVHYLTDVLAGWTLGLSWALACRWVERRWVARSERRALAHAAGGKA